jgi:hypothetical protein
VPLEGGIESEDRREGLPEAGKLPGVGLAGFQVRPAACASFGPSEYEIQELLPLPGRSTFSGGITV